MLVERLDLCVLKPSGRGIYIVLLAGVILIAFVITTAFEIRPKQSHLCLR